MTENPHIFERRLQRERKARKQAEQLLEEKSRELYEANTSLQNLADNLEKLVIERTRELTDMRDQALAGSRVKSAFLANMSHEIRTPLSSVIGMAELLQDSPLDEEQNNRVSVILDASRSLLHIINDILDLSKMEVGKLELDEDNFEICQLFDEIVETLGKPANDKQLELGATPHHSVPSALYADAARLRQIITNLMFNAIKFSDHGLVKLEARQFTSSSQPPMLHFAVSDQGIGISKQDQQKLFKKFSQLGQNKLARQHSGTGLGLSICHSLVEQMGGQIGCDSAPGQGSTFWFTLPLKATNGHAAREQYPTARLLLALVATDAHQHLLESQAAYLGLNCRIAQDINSFCNMLNANRDGLNGTVRVLLDANVIAQASAAQQATLTDTLSAQNAPVFQLDPPIPSQRARENDKQEQSKRENGGIINSVTRPLTFRKIKSLFGETLAPAAPTNNTEPSPNTDFHILLAEDSPALQLVTKTLLRKSGYRVEVATNGIEAIDAVRSGNFDLVLMDIQMPEMNGIEATQHIRQLSPPLPHDIPIIALTAFAMKGDDEEFLRAGMNDYVTKPINKQALNDVLKRWLPAVAKHTNTGC